MSILWVPKLLKKGPKKDRVDQCNSLLRLIWSEGLGFQDRIITMDKSAVSFHTSETKRQSKQRAKKGQEGPASSKVKASRTTMMTPVFLNSKGVIYTYHIPRGATNNAVYIRTALCIFVNVVKKRRMDMAAGDG
jgi:hypothetical protein